MSFKKMILIPYDEFNELTKTEKNNTEILDVINDNNINKHNKIKEIEIINKTQIIKDNDTLTQNNIDKVNDNIKLILDSKIPKKEKVILINKNIDIINIYKKINDTKNAYKNTDVNVDEQTSIVQPSLNEQPIENLFKKHYNNYWDDKSNLNILDETLNRFNENIRDNNNTKTVKPIKAKRKLTNNETEATTTKARLVYKDKKNTKLLSNQKINNNLSNIKNTIITDDEDEIDTIDKGSFTRVANFPLLASNRPITKLQNSNWSKF